MRNIIRLTNDFILRAGVHALPLRIDDLSELCAYLGYRLLPYQHAADALRELGIEQYTKHPAFTICIGNNKAVLFDSTLSTGTRIFAIAHEIGHIVLQHNYRGIVGFSGADSDQEREANTFAYQLIAPLCILRALNITDTRDVESRTLLDHDRAKTVHKALQRYHEQPNDNEMIRAYGVIQPQKKLDAASLLILLTAFLVAAALFIRELPDTQPPAETTQSFFAQLWDKQHPNTKEAQTTTDPEPQTTSPSPAQGETVYITRSGERYHKPDCYHIKNRTTTTLVLADALVEGYTACKDCYK